MKEIYYEVEEFDDGTFQIGCSDIDKEHYNQDIMYGAKRKRFVEIKDEK